MILVVREWFTARSQREQRLLIAMTVLASMLLVWLLVVRPLKVAYSAALERNIAAVDRNGRGKAMAEASRGQAAPAGNVGNADITLVLAERAAQSGLVLAGNDAAGPNDASVTIASASAIAASQWLAQLEQDGFDVRDVAMTPTADNKVAVTARLVRPAR